MLFSLEWKNYSSDFKLIFSEKLQDASNRLKKQFRNSFKQPFQNSLRILKIMLLHLILAYQNLFQVLLFKINFEILTKVIGRYIAGAKVIYFYKERQKDCLLLISMFVKDYYISDQSLKDNMEKTQCMGCRISFQDNQKLILQNLTTEYKNFQLPLKDDKAKWTILKTIVSFLNSQGGTIYIGIQDKQGAVQGQFLQRKDRDNFKLFLKSLIERIHPAVDLNHKQEVTCQFVPVLKGKQFEGKFVVKIVVQQGDPSQTYFFSQKVKLESSNNKIDEFQTFYAYQRHNMGGTSQTKGLKLMQMIYHRARIPKKIASTFHEGCNPQPPHLQVQIRKIYFSNTNKQHLKAFEDEFDANFEKSDIEYECEYLKDERIISISIDDENDFKTVQEFLVENIQYINSSVFQKFDNVKFEVVGEKNHYFLIENKFDEKTHKKEDKKQRKKSSSQETSARKQGQQKAAKQQGKKNAFPYQKGFRRQQQKPRQQVREVYLKNVPQSPSKSFSKKYGFTLSHINPKTIRELKAYLQNSICRNIDKNFTEYINTIEVFLSNEENLIKFIQVLYERANQIAAFGFKGEIVVGKNRGILKVLNYDKNKKNQLRNFIGSIMKDEINDIQFVKEKNQHALMVQLKSPQLACRWLDEILSGKLFKDYAISSGGKGYNNTPKIKVYLQLDQI